MSEEQNIEQPENDRPPTTEKGPQSADIPASASTEENKVISPEEPQTLDYKLQIDEMEVHHHGHVHERKKWKEYVFQFFMLFLAVFCGFLAEYQLEQTIERHREKDYMQLMVEDLQKDTAMLNITISRSGRVLNRLDTITEILSNEKFNDSLIKKAYELNLGILQTIQVLFTDRTSSQLKNAGTLRLIKNTTVVENLFNYWTKAEEIKISSEINNSLRLLAREKSYSIFNAKYYSSYDAGTNLSKGITPRFMTTDFTTLTEFSNRLGHIKNGIWYIYIPDMKEQFTRAVELIEVIRKEYHLK